MTEGCSPAIHPDEANKGKGLNFSQRTNTYIVYYTRGAASQVKLARSLEASSATVPRNKKNSSNQFVMKSTKIMKHTNLSNFE